MQHWQRLLDNPVWHNLCAGPHARYAIGTGAARRYARNWPALVGFADLARPDFDALAPHALSGELLYCAGWTGLAPAGWRIESESTLLTMTWQAALPGADAGADPMLAVVPLGAQHAAAALALATLAGLQPFTLGSIALGAYLGLFDGARLVAMAGARPGPGALCEISGVCTDPAFRGRGLAGRLVLELVRRQLLGSALPFLRVMREHTATCRLYRRLGFRDHGLSLARSLMSC